MNTLLVLGVNIYPDYFDIFTYDVNENRYIFIKRGKEKISEREKQIWNIFSFVECDLYENNCYADVKNNLTFMEQMETVEAKKYLRSIDKSLDKFLSPYNKDGLAMFSVDRVKDIINISNKFQIEFYCKGKKYKFPIKDIKFSNYLTSDSFNFIENRKKAINYINKKENDIYMIIHKFYKNQLPYISVIHSI